MELENKIAIGLVKEFYDAIEETDFHVPEFISGIPMADGSEEYGKILEEETFELSKTNAIICIKRMLNNRVSYPYPQEIEENDKEGYNYKIENGYIIPLDDKGREFPCCEYDYDEDGYEF